MAFEPKQDTAVHVWVTGAAGLIGHALMKAAGQVTPPEWKITPLTRADLDLDDPMAVIRRFEQDRPDCILHCAALSRTAACEANPALAQRLNVDATARLLDSLGSGRFVFFSSDLVFDGTRGGYVESDTPRPINVYGNNKWDAERLVAAHPGSLIIRTSLNHGHSVTANRGFNEEMVLQWKMGRPVNALVDEFRCPIAADVTARVVWELVRSRQQGIVHVAGSERLSRWEIASALSRHYPSLRPMVHPMTLKEYSGPPRAPDVSLDCTRLNSWLGHPMPAFRQWLMDNEPIHP